MQQMYFCFFIQIGITPILYLLHVLFAKPILTNIIKEHIQG